MKYYLYPNQEVRSVNAFSRNLIGTILSIDYHTESAPKRVRVKFQVEGRFGEKHVTYYHSLEDLIPTKAEELVEDYRPYCYCLADELTKASLAQELNEIPVITRFRPFELVDYIPDDAVDGYLAAQIIQIEIDDQGFLYTIKITDSQKTLQCRYDKIIKVSDE